ncbi:MAG: hypothetical protein AB2A00_08115 [Myxococcota bacterium]
MVSALLALSAGCGIRNLGETCFPSPESIYGPDRFSAEKPPTGEDIPCAPGRCHPDLKVCVECLDDNDCARKDIFDRPICNDPIPVNEGGDGLPFCTYEPRKLPQ